MKRWLLYVMCILGCDPAYSQQFPDIQFSFLTEKEGLSNNEVGCIAQDHEGFIWIGTLDGLNRYDGYRVKHFFHNPANENSLVNNGVFRIVPDKKNHLWISTREGLSIYDEKTGVFKNFRHNPTDTGSIDNDEYNQIYLNQTSSGWVSTKRSLYYFDSFFHNKKIFSTGNDPKTGGYDRLTEDRQGRLWGSNFEYLFLIDKKTMHSIKRFGPFQGNIQAFYQDSNLQFWVGTFGGGLFHFDPDDGEIATIPLAPLDYLVVYSLTEWRDQHHTRWLVVAEDHGLFLVDPVSLKSKLYPFHLGHFTQQIFTKNVVSYVFVDRQNILWVGTEAGVCYAEPSRQLFDLWSISNSNGATPETVSDWIYSISEAANGYWMTRWAEPNLYYFNKEGVLTRTVTSLSTAHGSFLLSDSLKPYYLLNQGDSVLWFTTNARLVHYDLQAKKALLYKPADGDSMTGFRTILPVNDHCWWIRTRNNGSNGIYIFDPTFRKFTKHFTHSPGCNGCVPANLLDIYLSKKNQFYVTAIGEGLFKYDPRTDHFDVAFKFQGDEMKQHSNSFESIAEDKQGILWIASYAGVFAYDPISKKLVHDYTNNELLGGVEVSGLVLDEQQNAWLNTDRGIFYILHSTGQLRKLIATEGLKNNSNGTFQAGKDDCIYSGIQGYVVRIRPAELLNRPPIDMPVHFSESTIMDTPRFFHYTSNGHKEMFIRPGQNRFSVDFTVMNYDGPSKYYYRVDGAVSTWQQNENGHLVFYNLAPGKYVLHVKGGNEYGELSPGEDSVTIIVEPYWWQTAWFKVLCIAFIISLAAFLVQRRIIHIRHEASFKQKIAETEMMALRSQMNPHFIFNSLSSIENFMMQNEKRLASSYLNKFARLIRTILESSRNELVPVSKDMEALNLYVDMEQLRFNHKFCFQQDVDPLLLNGDYKVPALLIQPYVENAIVHGLSHSEKNNLLLTVSAAPEGEYVHYSIRDNGIGRRLSALYNQQNKPHHKSVGLSITEERISLFNKRHGGNGGVAITDLYDENNEPAGTRVDLMIKAV